MKLKNIVAVAIVVVFCFVSAMFVLPALPLKFSFENTTSYKGFVDLWHIESFEGGSLNRGTWLKRRALEFEKQNAGLLIHITTLTYEQASQKLSDGDTFDLISFSYGIGGELLPHIQPFSGSAARIFDNFLSAGELENTAYALPFMTGVYGLFALQSDLQRAKIQSLAQEVFSLSYNKKVGKNTVFMQAVGAGFGQFNSPFSALFGVCKTGGSIDTSYDTTQYQAYEQFVSNKNFVALLGTQRDMFRLKNRMQQGKIQQLVFEPLNSFCDLVQFAAVSKQTKNSAACVAFVEYILSKSSQKKLADASMFSTTSSIYSDQWYIEAENALLKVNVPNVFTSIEILQNMRTEAENALKN